MGYMKYKGYSGSVEYSEEDNCLYGKVMGMSRDCITFEGQDVNELRRDFEGAVDDYLASCAARGVEPAKPYSGTFNVRVSPEIHSAIAMLAQKAGMSINAFIRQVLAKEVDLAYQTEGSKEREYLRTQVKDEKKRKPRLPFPILIFWEQINDLSSLSLLG